MGRRGFKRNTQYDNNILLVLKDSLFNSGEIFIISHLVKKFWKILDNTQQ